MAKFNQKDIVKLNSDRYQKAVANTRLRGEKKDNPFDLLGSNLFRLPNGSVAPSTAQDGFLGANSGALTANPSNMSRSDYLAYRGLQFQTGENERQTVYANGKFVRMGPSSTLTTTEQPRKSLLQSIREILTGSYAEPGNGGTGVRGSTQPKGGAKQAAPILPPLGPGSVEGSVGTVGTVRAGVNGTPEFNFGPPGTQVSPGGEPFLTQAMLQQGRQNQNYPTYSMNTYAAQHAGEVFDPVSRLWINTITGQSTDLNGNIVAPPIESGGGEYRYRGRDKWEIDPVTGETRPAGRRGRGRRGAGNSGGSSGSSSGTGYDASVSSPTTVVWNVKFG